jgi:RHS repeat-associated protein
MHTGANEVVYAYDADGNRIRTVVNGTEITNYLVDKNSPLSQVLLETDGQGAVMASYVYGSDLISMQRPDQGTRYYHYDGQMSTRQLSDATGAVSDSYIYDAFGNLMATTGDTTNRMMYSGEEYDPNLRTYYLRARYYDTTVGRFTARDPFHGTSAEDPMALNRYLYVHSDPINNSDPTGLFGFSLSAIVVSIAIFAFDPSAGAIPQSISPLASGLTLTSDFAVRLAVSHAKAMARAQEAGQYRLTIGKWFGCCDPDLVTYGVDNVIERHVREGWRKIAKATDDRMEFRSGDYVCVLNDWIAYANPADGGLILYLCPNHWGYPIAGGGDISQAGTIVHELSHEVYATEDFAYGEEDSTLLARMYPEMAIQNADNYSLQAEEWYSP